ncbi:macro domain-containing protein [Kitasatospora herbaricolor]|uniref:O-acetyl-ADP-ribose deacetylase n=1 Tax=Kitasatospora herbaricolor TaxID=68217 RepID=UPI00199D52B7|nr:O-acetyl-ADP-ribose deacetylase (regulator of RNase III) [Kitasatospora herbaricolor]GGV03177.1 macro domain-containing protein [Kitasatospora herbaricolor]
MTLITLIEGDITEQQVDVVVNAANSSLLGGGGVDGAIHRKGGPEILAQCRALRASHYGRGLRTGGAVATTAGRLPARWVVHTVGPVYLAEDYERRAELLASCYRESLRVAAELGARTVAFPAVSAGVYGWPLDDAARIALATVADAGFGPRGEEVGGERQGREREQEEDRGQEEGDKGEDAPAPAEVRFVLFGAESYAAFDRALRALERQG